MVNAADYLEQQLNLFTDYDNGQVRQDTSYGKTCQGLLVQIKDLILEPCSAKSQRPKFQCLQMESGQKQVMWNGGGTSSLAWRTLDAQYWGVPQRRKRIFLVADFGGFTAGEILFVEQGLHGDSAESEREREETATNVGTSTDSAVYESHPSDCRIKGPVKISPACTAKWHKGSADTPLVMSVYENHAQDSRIKGPLNVAPTVSATFGMGGNNTPIIHSTKTKIIENHPNVRRLLPLECERLQGLPDGYTDIEFNGKTAPDSRRYKAIGNGMAQPCAEFVIRRIAEVVSNEA